MNVLTGPNNAGKSSILDALRICKDVLRFTTRRGPQLASQPDKGVCATYFVDDSSISLSTENIVKDDSLENAVITLRADNGAILTVELHPQKRTVAYLITPGRVPKTAAQFRAAFPVEIVVVPTLTPFEAREKWVTEETTRLNETTKLSSRSFRNIWLRKSEAELNIFNTLVKRAWPEVLIRHPTVQGTDRVLEMNFIERGNLREVHWAGFGFQVWLQMMTHMMRGDTDAVLVLDEPDIYLHPDLQRKLTRIVQENFGQVFLATHSTEIINEVSAGDVLSIESRVKNARRITSEEGYRHIFKYLGSSENVEFARMGRARRIVFFEGDDRRLLRRLAGKAVDTQLLDDPDTVFLKTGGFGQWRRVSEVGWTLENVFGMRVKIAALFDGDYRCAEEITEFETEMTTPNIACHVLRRKEIENYCLHEAAIVRTMLKRAEESNVNLDAQECESIINLVFADLHDDVRSNRLDNYMQYFNRTQKRLKDKTLISGAMALFEAAWAVRERRFDLVGGKDFLSTLSHRFQKKTGKSITLAQIAQEMRVSEVPADLVQLVKEIESFFSVNTNN